MKHGICIHHIYWQFNKLNMWFYKMKIVYFIVPDNHKVDGSHLINLRTVIIIKKIGLVKWKRWFWRRSRHLPTILLKFNPNSKMIPDQSSRSIFLCSCPLNSCQTRCCVRVRNNHFEDLNSDLHNPLGQCWWIKTNIYSALLAPYLVGGFRSFFTRFSLILDSTKHVASLTNQPYANTNI